MNIDIQHTFFKFNVHSSSNYSSLWHLATILQIPFTEIYVFNIYKHRKTYLNVIIKLNSPCLNA